MVGSVLQLRSIEDNASVRKTLLFAYGVRRDLPSTVSPAATNEVSGHWTHRKYLFLLLTERPPRKSNLPLVKHAHDDEATFNGGRFVQLKYCHE